MNDELKALTQRLIDCSKEARSLTQIESDGVYIIGLSGDFSVHVFKGIENLSNFFGKELKEKEREVLRYDSDYKVEYYFDVDGVTFFELEKPIGEEYD